MSVIDRKGAAEMLWFPHGVGTLIAAGEQQLYLVFPGQDLLVLAQGMRKCFHMLIRYVIASMLALPVVRAMCLVGSHMWHERM
jgi:hypothetical protein